MPTKLTILRTQLNRLRQKRAAVRWTSSACAIVAVALWLLVIAFLCDWSFNLPTGLRELMLVAWIAAGIWSFNKFAMPVLSIHESAEDVALIVERRHHIDNDLIAALQFEKPNAKSWGSSRLTQAVVDYVADFSPSLNVFDGFSYHPLPKRAVILAGTILFVSLCAVAFPEHASVFWNRFLLGSSRYPTRTRIESVVVSGQSIPVFSKTTIPQIRIPYGRPVEVEVRCSGTIPALGIAQLSGVKNDSKNQVELRAIPNISSSFTGEITHIADSFRMKFQFGDATSDAVEIMIVPPPLIDIAWTVTPPKYAAGSLKSAETNGGSRQLSVLEGSKATLQLVCSNKWLKSARLKSGTFTMNLLTPQPHEPTSSIWTLPPNSLFESIHEALKYEIQVIDQDDLSLETPITGQFRLKTDRVPRIVASAVTHQVLPTAEPKLDYVAGDDFGISRIIAVISISREDGRSSRHEIIAKAVSETEQPLSTIRGQVAIALSPFELVKGDEVKVALEVTDWRGEIAGQKSLSEPNTFGVTDINGILTQTGEEDKKTAKQLDEILRRELGISGEKK